jgi:hypothetical protein
LECPTHRPGFWCFSQFELWVFWVARLRRQAPNVKKAKMYKVLKEVIEDTSVGSQSSNTAT